ncbi:hypothetical protein [Pseudozobellia thermophila]|uniref:Fibronectin type-III domain-containing protein n=1 Tax=Pseudozobellia thermophila TaxID=192903 RepID=A0A1M6CSR8_9FLAO|nr:hypothetical protein [Pseudozobellia thermophila]SHI64020.1 hypothetical protein SAMN04488513_101863 [Pseudozobellia thermophila]
MRTVALVVLGFVLLVGCKKDSPKAPEAVTLVAPEKNSECTPVQSTNGTSSVVRFSWLGSDHTESYELRVTNLETGTVQTRTTSATVETLSLVKGAPFSWQVISRNSKSDKTATSPSWYFYNPGAQTSHAPFPAEIISPESGATVFRNINNEVTLTWSGADIDEDILQFEIYFSEENPPQEIIATVNGNIGSRDISVDTDTVYYWKVVTTDSEGNTSDSGVMDFRCR